MFKHLYPCFSHWYHGGTIYFYSDPHFNDSEQEKIRHNYLGDEEQLKRINSTAGKNDTLIILGDVGDKEYLKKIRAKKILILGNHDSGATTYEGYADEIYEGALMISDKIILSHEPVDFKYAFNIHGHDHSNRNYKDSKHFNACAEWIDYKPVPIKYFIENGKLKDIPNIHRDTIDEAVERKKRKLM